MIGKPFINEELSQAIENYLKFKDKPDSLEFSSFPVMVIRSLVFIYGELDIINPYITRNENNMGGFNGNLMKYGISLELVQKFKECFPSFKQEALELKKPNVSFIKIEKYLIQMYFCKKKMMNLSIENQQEFKKLLYLKENNNVRMQEDLKKYTIHEEELDLYFQSIAFEYAHNFILEEARRSFLTRDAYTLLGYSMEQIYLLNDADLRNVNQQIYNFFRVDSNLENKEELLEKAVNYYKRYGNKVTSGNGFVDFLLFASILATAIFVTFLISVVV